MNIKVDFDNIVVKEDKNDFNVKVLMLKGEKGDAGEGEANIIEKVQVNGTDLPVTNKTVNVSVPVVDSALSSSSTNPVQNSAIYNALNNKVDNSSLNNYYQISQVDTLLNNKVNNSTLDDYYKKAETYSQSEINSINASLNSQISALANGSPLVANSTSGMNDTTKVYVNTTDGNWYYYNGTTWVSGGVYQSTKLEDDEVEYSMLENALKKQVSYSITKDTDIWENISYDTSGITHSNVGYATTKPIKVFPYEIIKTNVNVSASALAVIETDKDGNYISTIRVGDLANSYPVFLHIPTTETYYRFTYRIASFTSIDPFIDITSTSKVNYQELDESMKNLLQPSFDENSKIWTNGFFTTSTGAFSRNVAYSISDPIKVFKGQYIETNVNAPSIVPVIAKTDRVGNFISQLVAGTGNDATDISYTVTEDCYVRFTYRNLGISSVYINIKNLDATSSISGCAFGDSLWSNSKGNFNYTSTPYHTSTANCVGYDDWLAKEGIFVTNYAVSGSTIIDAWANTNYEYCIQNFNASMLENFDFVILSYGRNDSRSSIPLGNIGTQDDNFNNFNTNTIYGAYRKCIEYLWSLKPSLKIILWTMTQTSANGWTPTSVNSAGLTQRDYINAVKNLGEFYGIPVVDMYNNSGLNNYTLPEWTFEGVHLTNDGYKVTAPYYVNETKKHLK